MILLGNDENYGKVGTKTPLKDTNGDYLYVGDIVKIDGVNELSIVCGDKDTANIMGIWNEKSFGINNNWQVYKEKSYKSMKIGDEIRNVRFCEEIIKEMTIVEIEKELGYSIKIVKEK